MNERSALKQLTVNLYSISWGIVAVGAILILIYYFSPHRDSRVLVASLNQASYFVLFGGGAVFLVFSWSKTDPPLALVLFMMGLLLLALGVLIFTNMYFQLDTSPLFLGTLAVVVLFRDRPSLSYSAVSIASIVAVVALILSPEPGDKYGTLSGVLVGIVMGLVMSDHLSRSWKKILDFQDKLNTKNRELKLLSIIDNLTQLYNRRYFMEQLHSMISFHNRQKVPLTLMVLDLDYFKRINDDYGHPAGDRVLFAFASIIRQCVRESDVPARLGGQEFAVIFPNTDLDQAQVVVRRLMLVVKELYDSEVKRVVTFSGGMAQLREGRTVDDMLDEAEKNLRKAKEQGRNQVVPIS